MAAVALRDLNGVQIDMPDLRRVIDACRHDVLHVRAEAGMLNLFGDDPGLSNTAVWAAVLREGAVPDPADLVDLPDKPSPMNLGITTTSTRSARPFFAPVTTRWLSKS